MNIQRLQDSPEAAKVKERLASDPEYARDFLEQAGIIGKNGELTEEYGGTSSRVPKRDKQP